MQTLKIYLIQKKELEEEGSSYISDLKGIERWKLSTLVLNCLLNFKAIFYLLISAADFSNLKT